MGLPHKPHVRKTILHGLHLCHLQYVSSFAELNAVGSKSCRFEQNVTHKDAIGLFKVTKGHWFCYWSKAHMWLPTE